VQTSVSSGQLTISGVISGPTGLTKVGPGTLFLHTTTNTYTGTTDVQEGLLTLTGSVTVAIPGALVIGTGAGAAGTATVRDLTLGTDISATSNVTVNSDGVLDVSTGAGSEHIAGLTVNGGSVTLGSVSLTLNGPLAMTGGSISGTVGTLRLGGDVTATSSAAGAATISVPVALDGARTFTATPGAQATDLAVSNVLSDGTPAPGSLTKAGAGTLALTGAASNTYTGGTSVQAGTVTLNQTAGVSIPGNVTVGTGAGASGSATLRELQSSDLVSTASVTVDSDGVLDLNGHTDAIGGLTVNGGSVLLAGPASQLTITPTGSVSMTGGTIAGPAGRLQLQNAGLAATSSANGSATISALLVLGGTGAGDINPTFTVASGTAPELVVSGVISEVSGAHGLIKAGAGTLQATASETYSGTTAVTAGTFVANGQVPAALTVASQSTLTGKGLLGSVTVAGTLSPQVGLRTGPLSFSAGGSLGVAISSTDPSAMPTVTSSGPVTIDPAAVLVLNVAPGITVPGGTTFSLITNTGTGAIGGTFAGAPFLTPDGVPLTANVAGGDGNDLVLTAANVAPFAGSVSVAPASARTGQAVAFGVSPSDANRDSLTTVWSFGDGATAIGASASHAYTSAGTYQVTATVSDGAAQTQATTQITITGAASTTPAPAVSKLALAPAAFHAATAGASVIAAKGTKPPKAGTRVSLTVTSAATVRFTVTASQAGRKAKNGKCVVQTAANRHAKACTRTVTLPGSFSRTASSGTSAFVFTGRLSGHALKAAAYHLIATPSAAGKRGSARSVAFRVTRA
jgi:autotransporter-associated beta strand protein